MFLLLLELLRLCFYVVIRLSTVTFMIISTATFSWQEQASGGKKKESSEHDLFNLLTTMTTRLTFNSFKWRLFVV